MPEYTIERLDGKRLTDDEIGRAVLPALNGVTYTFNQQGDACALRVTTEKGVLLNISVSCDLHRQGYVATGTYGGHPESSFTLGPGDI